MHAGMGASYRLVHFYLLPLGLIAILCTRLIAVISAGAALLCADYFLQDPIYCFYTSEYLAWFAALVAVTITTMRRLLPRNKGNVASSQ